MLAQPFRVHQLTDADLGFVLDSSAGWPADRRELRCLLSEDESSRRETLGDEHLFQKVMARDDALALISPHLFFEILLRKTVGELGRTSHTLERSSGQRLAVFDAGDVVELVSAPVVLHYLADMLVSFTRVESYTVRVWVRRGLLRKVRYSDIDVRSLLRLAQESDEEMRFPLYKRIADVCLSMIGVFSGFPAAANRYPGTGALRPRGRANQRLNTEEYETLGQQMYGLAAQHPEAAERGLVEPIQLLRDHIVEAKKPLSFMAKHYLRYHRHELFGWEG